MDGLDDGILLGTDDGTVVNIVGEADVGVVVGFVDGPTVGADGNIVGFDVGAFVPPLPPPSVGTPVPVYFYKKKMYN